MNLPPLEEWDLPSDAAMLSWIEKHRASVEWSRADCWRIHVKTGETSSLGWDGGTNLRDLIESAMRSHP